MDSRTHREPQGRVPSLQPQRDRQRRLRPLGQKTGREDRPERTRREREKKAKEERERREASEKRAAEHAWKRAGNDPAEFEAAWPELRRRKQMERAEGEMGGDAAARERQRAATQRAF